MPKDEFDPDDPMELCGVGIVTEEDTTEAMTECFIEEFMRLGYNHKQILALFRNPHYTGMNMVLQNKGEDFVRDYIAETFAKWGRPVKWSTSPQQPLSLTLSPSGGEREQPSAAPLSKAVPEFSHADVEFPLSLPERDRAGARVCSGIDPTGALAPDINL